MPAAPLGYPALPDVQRLSSGRPVYGADMSLMVAAENHIAGVQLRQVWAGYVESRADTVQTYDGVGISPPVSTGISHTVHVFVQPNTLARHLLVFVHYLAERQGSTEPMITASLETVAGAVQDIGIRWRRTDGTLPCGHKRDRLFASSGVRVDDDLAAEATPSAPRMLHVPAGARGVDCWVKLETQECRLIQYTVAEFAEEHAE